MPTVWIPPLLQKVTGGQEQLTMPGATVWQVIEEMEKSFPGISEHLLDGDRVQPYLSVIVDHEVSDLGLRHQLTEESEVHFLPAIAGG